jgi:hypothetical protein
VEPWPAPLKRSLWGQQAVSTQQPQHPFAADVDLLLAAQPSPELEVTSPANGESASTGG